MSTALETIPQWNCNHNWMRIGVPLAVWTGDTTTGPPPGSTFLHQKVQCLNCNGVTWIYLVSGFDSGEGK